MNFPETANAVISSGKNKSHIVSKVICSILLFLAITMFFAARWYIGEFGDTGFDSIIFTLFSNTGGAQGAASDIFTSYIIRGLLPTIIVFCVLGFVLFFFPKNKFLFMGRNKKIKIFPIKHVLSVIISLVISVTLIVSASVISGLTEYINGVMNSTQIYEEYYVDPMSVDIEFPEKKRNLIYIFLESMENTFMSKEQGGALDRTIMPELYTLAEKNINFSHNEGVGGFLTPSGTNWTVAAMTAHTSGVPLKSPPSFERNTYGADTFLPGLNNLGDILNANGYYQALMVGSASEFANRNVYYKDHKTDKIYDIYTAREHDIIADDYYVWWGMEDDYLFEFARKELPKIAKQDKPFAFTMLTVDTHFTNGYVCGLCDDKFSEQYDNVISCSSHQVGKFINWLQKQSFYKDTTVIIAGDHLTMDSGYIERNVEKGYEQTVYNCFINSAVEGNNYKNRTFTSLDMFPTTLAAMGCAISGERLGLGTNLFSDKPTLSEEIGYSELDYQLGLNSYYYNNHFLK